MTVRTDAHYSGSQPDLGGTEDEIDLRLIVRAIWRSRWLVVMLGMLGGLAGVGISLLSTRYVAEALFLVPSMSMAAYKQYEGALASPDRLAVFLELNQLEGTQSAQLLGKLVEAPGAISKAIRPAFALTDREAKAYAIKSEDSEVLGFALEMERKERTKESPIGWLADYVRHTMIEVDLRDVMLNQCFMYRSKERVLRNEQIKSDFDASQARERAARLRELIARIPGAAQIDNRQVISLKEGAERFLSPTAQLVAVEVAIAEAALADTKRERERLAAALKEDYYCAVRKLQEEALTGQTFLARLEGIQSATFAGRVLSNGDAVEQAANEIALERQDWLDRYLERSRFVASTDGTEQKRRRPGIALGGLLGGMLGGLIGLILAIVLTWWRANRDAVLAGDEN